MLVTRRSALDLVCHRAYEGENSVRLIRFLRIHADVSWVHDFRLGWIIIAPTWIKLPGVSEGSNNLVCCPILGEVTVGQSTMQLTCCGTTRNFRKIRLQSSLLNCDYTLQVLQHASTRWNQRLHCNDVCVCVSIIRTTRKYKRLHSRLTVWGPYACTYTTHKPLSIT